MKLQKRETFDVTCNGKAIDLIKVLRRPIGSSVGGGSAKISSTILGLHSKSKCWVFTSGLDPSNDTIERFLLLMGLLCELLLDAERLLDD